MGNAVPFVYIKLDKERKYRLSNKALYIFEQVSEKSLSELDLNNLGIITLNQLIYAGLKSQDEEITLDQVIDLIDEFGDLEYLSEQLNKACEGSSFLQLKNSKKVVQ